MDAQFIQNTLANLDNLSTAEQDELWALLEELEQAERRELCSQSFMAFVKYIWPEAFGFPFIEGAHHKVLADIFDAVADGDEKRVCVNMAPRHTKSEFASYLLPAWYLGKYPHKKIIQCSNTADLATGFGRKVRNLIDSAAYREIFPDVTLSADSKSAGRWATNKGGEYFAVGVGGTVTGKGADILIIDDPHSEQEAALATGNPGVYDHVYEWYSSGPRQRLQPGGRIILVMCMTGDTDVLRADGTSTKLRDIRAGDEVATYANGAIGTSKVANWRSSGVDDVYTVQTQSGITLRANARHPFLVDADGEQKWVRLQDLKVGMSLVATRLATGAQPVTCPAPLSTYGVTLDNIVEISPAGREEVFDVEVERTENFIANGVVSHNTRWSKRDLTGRVLKSSIEKAGSDEWKLVELPAILDENSPTERALWPGFWSYEELTKLRAGLPTGKWQAQYQQSPVSEEGALIKRDWWRDWVDEDGDTKPPPKCKTIIMAGDTAFTKSDHADLSAFVTFGVFEREGANGRWQDNLILLDAWAERLEFPELKAKVRAEIRDKKPDCVIIEAKASGAPLIQELRMSGIPVQDFTPVRGKAGMSNDKVARTNSVTDILASGMVWACREHRYAQEVIDSCAEFPNGEHDDLVDCVVMALTRFRSGGFLELPGDDYDDEPKQPRRQVAYY